MIEILAISSNYIIIIIKPLMFSASYMRSTSPKQLIRSRPLYPTSFLSYDALHYGRIMERSGYSYGPVRIALAIRTAITHVILSYNSILKYTELRRVLWPRD